MKLLLIHTTPPTLTVHSDLFRLLFKRKKVFKRLKTKKKQIYSKQSGVNLTVKPSGKSFDTIIITDEEIF